MILRQSPYSVRMQENTEPGTLTTLTKLLVISLSVEL